MIDADVIEFCEFLTADDKVRLRDELRRIASLPADETPAESWCTHPPRARDAEFHALELAILRRVVGETESLT